MIDTHMHFENEDYNKIDDIITRAKEKEVNYFILSSTSNNDIEKCLSISNKYSSIFVTLGYHPEVASEVTLKDLKKLDILLSSEKVVGIGEIVLDYHSKLLQWLPVVWINQNQ